MKRLWPPLALVLAAFSLFGYLGSQKRAREPEAVVRVFAAASLTDAFQAMAEQFEHEHPGVRVEMQFAGSQVLRAQIEQGAPADVFASADERQMKALRDGGFVKSARGLTHNALVVVARSGSPVRNLVDLARPDARLVLAGPEVPAGRYGERVLARLATAGGSGAERYGPEFAARVRRNVASRETNVRAVLAKVTLGEADAGIVYATDALTARDAVTVIPIPDAYNVAAAYEIGCVANSSAPELADAFVRVALSPEGRTVLQRHGFTP